MHALCVNSLGKVTQSLGSVGGKMTHHLGRLGRYTVKQLKTKNSIRGVALTTALIVPLTLNHFGASLFAYRLTNAGIGMLLGTVTLVSEAREDYPFFLLGIPNAQVLGACGEVLLGEALRFMVNSIAMGLL